MKKETFIYDYNGKPLTVCVNSKFRMSEFTVEIDDHVTRKFVWDLTQLEMGDPLPGTLDIIYDGVHCHQPLPGEVTALVFNKELSVLLVSRSGNVTMIDLERLF